MSRPSDEREVLQNSIFVDHFPIHYTAGFHRDIARLNFSEPEIQTLIDVFRANGLMGITADTGEFLQCCVISALSAGLYYAIAQNLKGIHFIGVRRLSLGDDASLNIRDAVDFDMISQAKRLGISTNLGNLKSSLRSRVQGLGIGDD